MEIIGVFGTSEADVQDHVEKDGYPKKVRGHFIKYAFDIGIVNRVNSYKPSYSLSFIVKGAIAPTVDARINEASLKSQKFTRFKLNDKTTIEKYGPIAFLIVFIPLYISFLIVYLRQSNEKQLRQYGELSVTLVSLPQFIESPREFSDICLSL